MLETRLTRPNFNCYECRDIWEQARKPPACWVNKCELEGIIDDPELNAIVDSYLGARRLGENPAFAVQAQQLLADSGLTEYPLLLVEFDLIVTRAIRQHYEREKKKREAKQIVGANRGGRWK